MKRRSLATATVLALALSAADATAQQQAAPVAPVAPAGPTAGPAPVRLHLRTLKNKSAARMSIHRADGSYTLVCASPCTADVPGGSELRVTLGNDDDDPHTFVLPTDLGSELDLEVRPPSVGPLVGSIVLIGSGGALVLSGLAFIALADVAGGSISASSASTSATHKSISDTYKTTGYVMIGIGAAAAVAGFVWLLARSHEPQVSESPHREPDVYGRRETLLGDVAVATPCDPTSAARALPAPFTPLQHGFSF
jgi:hypothetical protein